MNLDKTYGYDKELAEKGVRIPLGSKDSYIVVAKFGNKRFQKLFSELTEPYGKRIERLEAEQQKEIYLECLAETVVLDWGGIMDGKVEVPYSKENVIAMFEKYPDFHAEVLELSKEVATFKKLDQEEDLGNSATPSEQNSSLTNEPEQP